MSQWNNKRPRGLDDLLELKTQYTRMFWKVLNTIGYLRYQMATSHILTGIQIYHGNQSCNVVIKFGWSPMKIVAEIALGKYSSIWSSLRNISKCHNFCRKVTACMIIIHCIKFGWIGWKMGEEPSLKKNVKLEILQSSPNDLPYIHNRTPSPIFSSVLVND